VTTLPENETAEARRAAEQLLRIGRFGGPTSPAAQVLEPLAVHAPDGSLHSWFVPVADGETLLGFAELLADLSMTRYSSFQRRAESTDGCPSVAQWTCPSAVLATIEPHLLPGEIPGEPVLTFDRVPSRLAWAVDVAAPDGTHRRLFVAGGAVWQGTAGREDSVDGPGAFG
jgi:hypothetical protein